MKPAREEEEEDTIEESRAGTNEMDDRLQENRQEITAGEQQSWQQIASSDTSYRPPKDKNQTYHALQRRFQQEAILLMSSFEREVEYLELLTDLAREIK